MFCFAQKSFSGKIVDEEDRPLEMVNVMLYPDSLHVQPMLSFAVTGKDGNFTLNVPDSHEHWIFFRSMGYEDKTEKLSFSDSLRIFFLHASAHLLEEVIATANYTGMKVRGDSVIFDISHFKSGTEENISDLLQRLPGVEVSKTGNVRFEGKNVSMILINGDDVMGTGSGMMINGLSSDIVEGIEVLRNWNDGNLSNSLRRGDGQTALNIRTAESLHFTGKTEAAGGILNKYHANATMLAVGGHGSLTVSAASNNTGKEIISLEDYVSHHIMPRGLASGGYEQMQLSEEESNMLNPPSDVYANRNSALILNGVLFPSKSLDITVGLLLNNMHTDAYSQNSTVYLSSMLSTEEADSTENDNTTSSANMKVRWHPTDNIELLSNTFLKSSRYSDTESMTFLSNDRMTVNQHNRLDCSDLRQSLQFTRMLSRTALYTLLTFDHSTQHQGLNLHSDSLLLSSYQPLDDLGYSIEASTDTHHTSFSAEIGSKWALREAFSMGAGILHNSSKDKISNSDLYWFDHEAASRFRKSSAFAYLEKSDGLLRFNARMSVVRNSYDMEQLSESSFATDFNAQLRFVFSPKNELILTGSQESTCKEINRMASFPRHLSYNRVQQSSQINDPFLSKNEYSLHYRLINNYNRLMLFVSGFYSKTDGTGLRDIQQDGIVSNITFRDGGHEERMSLYSVISKGLSSLPADVRLKLSWQKSKSQAVMNENPFTSSYQVPQLELSLTTRARSVFNLDVGTSYERRMFRGYSSIKRHSDLWRTFLQGHFATGGFKSTLKYEINRTNGNGVIRTTHNVGFLMSYRIRQVKLSISGENILHLRNNEWLAVTNSSTYSQTSFYQRMPGHLMLSIGWQFQ